MRTKKNYSLPKPLVDFSNVDTSFADKMKPFDDEKNGRLNVVLVENTPKSSKSTKSTKSSKSSKSSKQSKLSKSTKSTKSTKSI